MSWWVYLEDRNAKPYCNYAQEDWKPEYDGDVQCSGPCYPSVAVTRHTEGGTYAVGGTDGAELSVTYNYSKLFFDALGGVGFRETLHSMQASVVVGVLERAVEVLGDKPEGDYWDDRPGNAGHVLNILLGWAKEHPTAVFRVS